MEGSGSGAGTGSIPLGSGSGIQESQKFTTPDQELVPVPEFIDPVLGVKMISHTVVPVQVLALVKNLHPLFCYFFS